MMTRMTALTVLIAGIGTVLSFLVQDIGERPGSAFGSLTGDDCDYRRGIVCPLVRDPIVLQNTIGGF